MSWKTWASRWLIFPASALMAACRVVGDLMGHLKTHGTTEQLMPGMASLAEAFETVGLSRMLATDSRYSG